MHTASPYCRLLQRLDVRSLGAGSAEAGTDMFVAMCATLASVAHPDSRLVSPSGRTLTVGLNTLTLSSLSKVLIDDWVVGPLINLQNQHLRNTRSRQAHLQDRIARSGARGGHQESTSMTFGDAGELPNLQMADGIVTDDGQWLDERHPSQVLAELRNHPVIYFSGRNPLKLSSDLRLCHLQSGLVGLHVARDCDYEQVEAMAEVIVGGTALDHDTPFQFRGRVQSSMNVEVAQRVVFQSPSMGCLLGRSLWLTGGPLLLPPEQGATRPGKGSMQTSSLYAEALRATLLRRFRNETLNVNITEETLESCYRYVDELTRCSERFPGLSSALYSLLPTLIYGLSVMDRLYLRGKPHPYPVETFTGLARALSNRMIRCRDALIQETKDEQVDHVSRRIHVKLEALGPLTERQITRRFNRLPISECRAALGVLQSRGIVELRAGNWHLIHPSVQFDDLDSSVRDQL